MSSARSRGGSSRLVGVVGLQRFPTCLGRLQTEQATAPIPKLELETEIESHEAGTPNSSATAQVQILSRTLSPNPPRP